MPNRRPVVLVILDGWGNSPDRTANAVALAETPVFDRLAETYLQGTLRTSGHDVGLPEGQMGNSEVGHLTLGAGCVIDQDLLVIDRLAAAGAFDANPVVQAAFEHVRSAGRSLHLLGLVGDGGVHAHTRHLFALLGAARRAGLARVFLHAFTDGRDTPPTSGQAFMREITAFMQDEGIGQVATVCGRYWAMDRDQRWDRTTRAWAALVDGTGRTATSPEAAIAAGHAGGETDEFIAPTVVTDAAGLPLARIEAGDAVILFNFRADRVRQILSALTDPDFDGFPRRLPADLFVATMTEYQAGQRAAVIAPSKDVEWPLARVLSDHGRRQFHTAETEKYAHVTYFFNGGREAPFPGETRHMVPSPKVATYDRAPEMSAAALTDDLVTRIASREDDFVLVNYANADMVGHTGDLEAAIIAVETVDACLGRVLDATAAAGGTALVTADHGNCEMMIDPATGGPHTAHTLNPVPLVIVDPAFRRDAHLPLVLEPGALSDVAPTILALLGVPAPPTMTGRVLFSVAPSTGDSL
jgi:2,3-bisphosphoglycerate-independent phosphoglycerate mutase